MLLLSALLIGCITSTSLPETSLANAPQGAHHPDLGTQIIPTDFMKEKILEFLEVDDGINAKNWLGYSEKRLIKLFSKSQPEKVASYIVRELDNPLISNDERLKDLDTFLDANSRYPFRKEISLLIVKGKVDLVAEILRKYRQFSRIRFDRKECLEAAQNGHDQMVEFILDWSETSSDAYYRLSFAAIEGSVKGNQFKVFKMIVDQETYILEALQYAISRNNINFVRYCIQKINAGGLRTTTMSDNWYAEAVLNSLRSFGLMDNEESTKMLVFLLNQPNWKPKINELLLMMLLARNSPALEIIQKEFVRHKSITDQQGIPRNPGTDALDAAIRQARSSDIFGELVETLQDWREDLLSI